MQTQTVYQSFQLNTISVVITQGNKYPFVVKAEKATPKGKYAKSITLFNYGFPSLEKAAGYYTNYISKIQAEEKRKADEKAATKERNANFNASAFYSVGDIVVNSWGYEQTNIEFYQVIEVKNKSLLVREVGQTQLNHMSHGMACDVLPEKDNFIGEPFMLRLRMVSWSEKPIICNPESYYYFKKWSGLPQYKSWYA